MSRFIANNFSEYLDLYQESVERPEEFWSQFASIEFLWKRPWDSVLEHDLSEPSVSWFKGAQLNITENCIDRHLEHNGEENGDNLRTKRPK